MPTIQVLVNTDDTKDVSAAVRLLSKFLSDETKPLTTLVAAEIKEEPAPAQVFRQNDKVITPPPTVTEPVNPITADLSLLDKDGIPWDGRIHRDTKVKTVDGYWRRRRNISDETYNGVVAALKGTTITPPPVTPPPAPPAAQPAAVPPQSDAQPLTFATLTTKLGAAVTAGKVTHEQVMQILGNHGVVGLKGLLTAQGVYESVNNELNALLALS